MKKNILIILILLFGICNTEPGFCLRPLMSADRAFHFSDTFRFRNGKWALQISERPDGIIDITIINGKSKKELAIVKNGVFVYKGYDEVELRKLLLDTTFFEEDRIRRSSAIDWWSDFFESKRFLRHLYKKKEDDRETRGRIPFELTSRGNAFCSLYIENSRARPDCVDVSFSIGREGFKNFKYTDLGTCYILGMLHSGAIPKEPLMVSGESYFYGTADRIMGDALYEKLRTKGAITYAFTDSDGKVFYFIKHPRFLQVAEAKVSETESCHCYQDSAGRTYISLISKKGGKLIVSNNKRQVTATADEVKRTREIPFVKEHAANINWEPDYVKDMQEEMANLLNAYDGNYHFPKGLLQSAALLGLNPVDIISPVLREHFHPEEPAHTISKKEPDSRYGPAEYSNKEWYVKYLETLEQAIISYHRAGDIIGKKNVGSSAKEPHSAEPKDKADFEAWESFVKGLWQPGSKEYKEAFQNYVCKSDLNARKSKRKIPKPAVVDKGSLDQEIARAFLQDGSGQRMWQFIGSVFGRWRSDIQIEITTLCNLKCEHCLAMPKMLAPMHRGKQMDKESIKARIRSLKGADRICFTGGEPFLYGYIGRGEELRAALSSGNGVLSEDFLEILQYAKEMGIKEVIIDTNGFGFPVDDDKARRFFRRLPDNVVFELSLDDEHIDELKRRYNREARDVVRVCELYARNGVKYNLRIKGLASSVYRDDAVKQLLNRCDFEGRVLKKYSEGTSIFGDTTRSDAKARLSRAKLQGNAVKNFNIDRGYGETYSEMKIEKLAEDFFPTNTFLFVGYNEKVFFDAHCAFMPNPPPISYLGDLTQSSLAEVMLDGMIGRFVNFEDHPYLRYLYLAKYFAYIGNKDLSAKCLAYARSAGKEYEERYSRLTGGVGFSDIGETGYDCLLAQHFRIAVADNLISGKNLSWLSDIIPVNSGTDVIWDLGYSWDDDVLYPYFFELHGSDYSGAGKHLICAAVRNYIKRTPKMTESLDACSDTIIEALKDGKCISENRAPLFKTAEDGGFSFLFFRKSLDEIEIPHDRKSYEKAFGAIIRPLEKQLRYTIELNMGEHSIQFYQILSDKLSAYIKDEADPKRKWVARKYLDLCEKRIERKWQRPHKPVIEGEPDVKAYFLNYLVDGLTSNKEYTHLDQVPLKEILAELKEGALQYDRNAPFAKPGSIDGTSVYAGQSVLRPRAFAEDDSAQMMELITKGHPILQKFLAVAKKAGKKISDITTQIRDLINQQGIPLNMALERASMPVRIQKSNEDKLGDSVKMTARELMTNNLNAIAEIVKETHGETNYHKILDATVRNIETARLRAMDAAQNADETGQLTQLEHEMMAIEVSMRLFINCYAVLRNGQYFQEKDFDADLINFVNNPKVDLTDRVNAACAVFCVRNTTGGLVALYSDEAFKDERQRAALEQAIRVAIDDAKLISGLNDFPMATADLFARFIDADTPEQVSNICSLLKILREEQAISFKLIEGDILSRPIVKKILEVSDEINDFETLNELSMLLIFFDPARTTQVVNDGSPEHLVYFAFIALQRRLEAGIENEKLRSIVEALLKKRLEASQWPQLSEEELEQQIQNPAHQQLCDMLLGLSDAEIDETGLFKAFALYYPNEDLESLKIRFKQAIARVNRNMLNTPRHLFLPTFAIPWSSADTALPIPLGYGQTISQPYVVQLMTAFADPKKTDRVLEIGTGSGYQAAVLASMTKEVHTIEVYKELSEMASHACDNVGLKNIKFWKGDGSKGLAEGAPFDIIIVTAGAPALPEALMEQLSKDGGRMLIPVEIEGERNSFMLTLIYRSGDEYTRVPIMRTMFVPLYGSDGYGFEVDNEMQRAAISPGPPKLMEGLTSANMRELFSTI